MLWDWAIWGVWTNKQRDGGKEFKAVITCGKPTFPSHAALEAFLQPTILTLVAVVLVYGAVPRPSARVGQVPPHWALEEALAALAGELSIVLARAFVPTHHTLYVRLVVVVLRGHGRRGASILLRVGRPPGCVRAGWMRGWGHHGWGRDGRGYGGARGWSGVSGGTHVVRVFPPDSDGGRLGGRHIHGFPSCPYSGGTRRVHLAHTAASSLL